jgi:uncharacterized protein
LDYLFNMGSLSFYRALFYTIILMEKIVIAGGSGFLGSCLANHYIKLGCQVVILTRGTKRKSEGVEFVNWDGVKLSDWAKTLEGADALINLNGKSVDCRYTKKNQELIYSSRLNPTAVLGEAVSKCINPPKVWINSSSATIYRYSLDKEMDEKTGEIGSGFSVDVCEKWEKVFWSYPTPGTRKIAIRTGIVLGKNGGPLKKLKQLVNLGLGGKHGSGNQYFSWLHETDFLNIVNFLLTNKESTGVYNLTAPQPIPNKEVMNALRNALHVPFGLPMPQWLLEIGAVFIRTETELILKSRRVIPTRLLESGYRFTFNYFEEAVNDLCKK